MPRSSPRWRQGLPQRAVADGRVSGALAAAFFAACPLLAEGVFWVSARSDPSVTLLTLAGLFFWAAAPDGSKAWLGLPLLLLPALGFKESAAVLPLQLLVIALAWPQRPARGQLAAIVAAFAVAAAFLAFRAYLFGDAWHVYPAGEPASPIAKLGQGVRSLDAWWHGLTRATPGVAPAYLVACVLALLAAAACAKGDARRLALALTIASVVSCGRHAAQSRKSGSDGRRRPPYVRARRLAGPCARCRAGATRHPCGGRLETRPLAPEWCSLPPRPSRESQCSKASLAGPTQRSATYASWREPRARGRKRIKASRSS
jgi:hypothetical protein